MPDLILLGFYVGDQYFEKYSKGDAYPQVAAFKLESRFLESLRSAGVRVTTVGSIAVSTFPNIKKVWFPAKSLSAGNDACGKVLPLINLPFLKLLTRFIGSLYYLVRHGNKFEGVCVYAAHSPNLLAAFLFSKLYRKPFYVYIPDLPSFMDVSLKRNGLARFFKRLDASLLDRLLQAAAGLLVISRPMIEDSPALAHKPYMVLEGIAEQEPPPRDEVQAQRKLIFYAGGVNRAYGIKELVEGYLRSEVDYDLVLCGRGDLEGYLHAMSAEHPSIKYLGFLPPAKVAELQAQAAFLVLTRDPAEAFTRYSFPSKLLEYMAAGIPVLTTRLPGIPEEYFDYLNVVEGYSVEAIAKALTQLCAGDQACLSVKAARGRIWVLETKSGNAVGKRIIEFMEKCK